MNRIPVNNPRKIIDNSENMILTAKQDYPNLDFKVYDATTKLSGLDKDFDIVFSNACIQ